MDERLDELRKDVTALQGQVNESLSVLKTLQELMHHSSTNACSKDTLNIQRWGTLMFGEGSAHHLMQNST